MKSSCELNFEAQADRQRRRMRQFMKLAACGAALAGAAVFGPSKWTVWIGVPGTLTIFASMAIFFTVPGLSCPNCGKSAEDFDGFCPVCGTAGLHRVLTVAKCDGCHHTLDHYKTRNYTIHFCTYCGALLDRRGAGIQVLQQHHAEL